MAITIKEFTAKGKKGKVLIKKDDQSKKLYIMVETSSGHSDYPIKSHGSTRYDYPELIPLHIKALVKKAYKYIDSLDKTTSGKRSNKRSVRFSKRKSRNKRQR